MTLTPNELMAVECGNILSWVETENRARTNKQFIVAVQLWNKLSRREKKAYCTVFEAIVYELLDMAIEAKSEPIEIMFRECKYIEYIPYTDHKFALAEALELYLDG